MSLEPKHSIAQNKLLLLYLLNTNPKQPGKQITDAEKGGIRLTELQILRIVEQQSLMNYFDLKESLFELKENDLIVVLETPQGILYQITPNGRNMIGVLMNDLRHSFRQAVDGYMRENHKELQKESQYIGEYLKLGNNEYRVTLKVLEDTAVIFEINLRVYSREQAQHITEKWKDRAVEVYKSLMIQLS